MSDAIAICQACPYHSTGADYDANLCTANDPEEPVSLPYDEFYPGGDGPIMARWSECPMEGKTLHWPVRGKQ